MRYWKRIDTQGATRTVEAYSFDGEIEGAIEITKEEYDAFIAGLPKPLPPTDWKSLWKQAMTTQDKLSVIARYLRWE
jgi:hypothetical protein